MAAEEPQISLHTHLKDAATIFGHKADHQGIRYH